MKWFSYLPKKLLVVFIATLAVAGIAGIATVANAGFGPDRPIKDWSVNQTGFDYVTYNSFINMEGKGDERNFLEGVQVGRDDSWRDPINNVEAGEVEIKLYMHNNAATHLNDAPGNPGIARNVKARVELPVGHSQTMDVKGFVEASNAVPTIVYDSLTINGANGGNFAIEPIIGSGKLIENGQVIGAVDVAQLISGGVSLPDQHGCSEFVREITFRVKTVVASWTLEKEVSHYNKGQFAKSVTAKPGDKLDYLLTFRNIGNTTLNNVVIGDRLPAGVKYQVGTTEWLAEHTDWKWKKVDNDNLFTGGIDIAGYQGYKVENGQRVYAEAYVRFVAQVVSEDKLECGQNVLTNIGFAKPKDFGTIQATADTVVNRECKDVVTYQCVDLKLEKLGGRRIKATVSTNASPANRVSVKNFEYNFGDGSTPLVTDKNAVEYAYQSDGTFKVAVKVTFSVDGQNKTVGGAQCEGIVTLSSVTPPAKPPTTLPVTGAGSLVGMFVASTLAGLGIFRRLALRR